MVAIADCSDEVRDVVLRMVSVVDNPQATGLERQRALAMVADVLRLTANDEAEHGASQQAEFADRLRTLMTERCVTQQELAQRIGFGTALTGMAPSSPCDRCPFAIAEGLPDKGPSASVVRRGIYQGRPGAIGGLLLQRRSLGTACGGVDARV